MFYQTKHQEALLHYIKSQNYYKKTSNDFYLIKIKHYIGLLKNATKNDKEALSIFKENMLFLSITSILDSVLKLLIALILLTNLFITLDR